MKMRTASSKMKRPAYCTMHTVRSKKTDTKKTKKQKSVRQRRDNRAKYDTTLKNPNKNNKKENARYIRMFLLVHKKQGK